MLVTAKWSDLQAAMVVIAFCCCLLTRRRSIRDIGKRSVHLMPGRADRQPWTFSGDYTIEKDQLPLQGQAEERGHSIALAQVLPASYSAPGTKAAGRD